MRFDWIYLTFQNGFLYEDGRRFSSVKFASAAAAEAWLEENDIRASVR